MIEIKERITIKGWEVRVYNEDGKTTISISPSSGFSLYQTITVKEIEELSGLMEALIAGQVLVGKIQQKFKIASAALKGIEDDPRTTN